MIFRSWRQGEKLEHGIWNIPVPAEGAVVTPTLLLVPLVGFDPAGYRLGYGGGYYDRTLAQCVPRALTIGIGYAMSRLATIHPQPHDIPMDRILTEDGWLEPAHDRLLAAPAQAAGTSSA
jgi:5,10-methenyltetrahydrofolate synthetase